MRFEGKIAVVTGGASGIGAATARLLAKEGAFVVIGDVQTDVGSVLAAEIGGEFVHTDVSDRAQVEALVAAGEAHGGPDILFNNAGIGSFGQTPDLDPELWRRVLAIDLDAVFYACRTAIPLMKAKGGGVIVNTASISGLGGDYGFAAYNAAKAAVINYTRTLAIDHGPDGIRANALCPGLVDTPIAAPLKSVPGLMESWMPLIPLGRASTAEEQAKVVAFLCSEDASYVTGCVMVADGGVTAHTGQPNFMRLAGAALATAGGG